MNLRRSVIVPLVLAATLGAAAASRDPGEVLEIKGWGKAIDPDGDCRFTVEKGKVTIAIPGTVHALSAERGHTNAPRILEEIEGDFTAQVKVSGVSTPKTASLVRARRPFRAAGLILWVDAGSYIRLERAGMRLGGEDLTYANFESRKGRRFERVGDGSEHPLEGEATYLRLERRGGMLTASVSPDGACWSPLEPFPAGLPARVRIGVAATHNTAMPFEARFEEFRVTRGLASQ